ncbi:MAG: ATP-dependent helicase [Streptomyces sp.]|nr:ATP-dependent helicase [Streptomyces sp.]
MPIKPTLEQEAARDVFAAGRDLALIAGAGTGKTSTLQLMGESTTKKGLYIAFNRSIADEAGTRFKANVRCRTAHSLARAAVGGPYNDRLNSPVRVPGKAAAKLLGITRDLVVNSHQITPSHQARLVTGMVRRFCYSTDLQVGARHMERINGLDLEAQAFVAQTLLPYALKAWDDICLPAGRLTFEHDHYLKMWALTSPVLEAEFVLLDEAQDTNPVLEEIFLAQSAQRVCVGDPAQQIYEWRNARDVMTGFPAEHLQLAQSFRFGPQIAEVANRWLALAESDLRLTGRGPADSRVGTADHADAVLCRGNADAMHEVLGYLEAGVPVALTGGGEALKRIAKAAQELKAGRKTSHPELFLFTSWGEVQEYVEQDSAGQDLKAIVKLVDSYGPDVILQAVERLTPEEDAKVSVSTAHKAKGREWATVRIGDGFVSPSVDEFGMQRRMNPAEARLIYVAVTRARLVLDQVALGWVDGYETKIAPRASAAARDMIRLPLVRQLKTPGSPMSVFMAEHLPNGQRLVWDYLQCLQQMQLPHPVQPIDTPRPDWAALGHAVDSRIRLSLGGNLGGAVDAGVRVLASGEPLPGAPGRETREALYVAGIELMATIDLHLAEPDEYEEDFLSRLCFVAAFYEDIFRTGELRRHSMFARVNADVTLLTLLDAVPDYAVTDLHQQMTLAETALAGARALPGAARICGPTFAGSSDIGGADADFILGGLLLDCKATIRPRALGLDEVRQLTGYLLLDYDDRYGIDRVGLYLSRQGAVIHWGVTEFLQRQGATASLPELRRRLREYLRALP